MESYSCTLRVQIYVVKSAMLIQKKRLQQVSSYPTCQSIMEMLEKKKRKDSDEVQTQVYL